MEQTLFLHPDLKLNVVHCFVWRQEIIVETGCTRNQMSAPKWPQFHLKVTSCLNGITVPSYTTGQSPNSFCLLQQIANSDSEQLSSDAPRATPGDTHWCCYSGSLERKDTWMLTILFFLKILSLSFCLSFFLSCSLPLSSLFLIFCLSHSFPTRKPKMYYHFELFLGLSSEMG